MRGGEDGREGQPQRPCNQRHGGLSRPRQERWLPSQAAKGLRDAGPARDCTPLPRETLRGLFSNPGLFHRAPRGSMAGVPRRVGLVVCAPPSSPSRQRVPAGPPRWYGPSFEVAQPPSPLQSRGPVAREEVRGSELERLDSPCCWAQAGLGRTFWARRWPGGGGRALPSAPALRLGPFGLSFLVAHPTLQPL